MGAPEDSHRRGDDAAQDERPKVADIHPRQVPERGAAGRHDTHVGEREEALKREKGTEDAMKGGRASFNNGTVRDV